MKILAITSIRSEYDLMSELYLRIDSDPDLELKLVVGGAHTAESKGNTYRDIESDGLDILLKIESLIDADTNSSRLKSMSVLLISLVDAVSQYSPDLILYAGDREEVMIGALLGGYLSIPTIHFFAGDHASDGHIDNPLRHATSKLSTVSVVSMEEHVQRLRRIGEPTERIFNIGSIAIDKFKNTPIISNVLKDISGKSKLGKTAIFIFHPVEEEFGSLEVIVENTLTALSESGYHVFVGLPNTDAGNAAIEKAISKISVNSESFTIYGNLPRTAFVNMFRNVDLIIGNSSAGILEAASIPIPAINVGARQRGRVAGENVVFVDATKEAIEEAIGFVESENFLKKIKSATNPYGNGDSVDRAVQLIKSIDFKSVLKKSEDPLDV